jgi:DNA-binding NtrC family response regulator
VRVAAHDTGVLITGPSGTGKELIARALHAHSPRREAPFVAVDCAALPGELFASQMFGHLKGAFTGAHYAALGAFRAAEGGTIFLDEIGELDLTVQAKLLRSIQERTVVPLGSHQGVPINVRIVAATNRDLAEEVRRQRFREDLYYRINVVALATAPLAERREDIEPLARYFLHKLSIDHGLPLKWLTPAAANLVRAFDWPGNVRELFNELERTVVLWDGDAIEPHMMPRLVASVFQSAPLRDDASAESAEAAECRQAEASFSAASSTRSTEWPTLADIERNHILLTLERTHYNQSAAARLLGINRNALRRYARALGLDLSRSRRGRPVAPESTAAGIPLVD